MRPEQIGRLFPLVFRASVHTADRAAVCVGGAREKEKNRCFLVS